MLKICKKCGKEFKIDSANQKYCNECNKVECLYCGKIFEKEHGGVNRKFCSKNCTSLYRKGKISKKRNGIYEKCLYCGKRIYVTPSQKKIR